MSTDYNPWDDPALYVRCVAEGRSASANNLPLDVCSYQGGTAERSFWMDGYEG